MLISSTHAPVNPICMVPAAAMLPLLVALRQPPALCWPTRWLLARFMMLLLACKQVSKERVGVTLRQVQQTL